MALQNMSFIKMVTKDDNESDGDATGLFFFTILKKKLFYTERHMPFSIPTYFVSEFVRSATLHERRSALKKILKSKFIFVSTFPVVHGVQYLK